MKITAIITGSVFDKDKFLTAKQLVDGCVAKGEKVVLLPIGMAKRAIKADKRADFLYFLGGHVNKCIIVPGESIDETFISALRTKMESMSADVTVVQKEDIRPFSEEDEKEADKWQTGSMLLNESIAGGVFGFSEAFLNADHVEDISDVLSSMIPDNCFICMRDSFLQDLYTERGTAPGGYEKFYVLADSRKDPRVWANFPLRELFPERDQVFAENKVLTIIPIHCRQAYFGYLVHLSESVDSQCGVLEMSTVVMDLVIARYITERKLTFANHELLNANENVARLQETDVLTGLRNSMGFMKDAQEMLDGCLRKGFRLVTVCVDLDRLGNINEIYGHLEGDIAIQMLAQIIQDSVPTGALAARLGSDEFIVISPQDDVGDMAESFTELIRNRINTYNRISGKEYTLEANISALVITPEKETQVEDVLEEAFARKRLLKESRSGRHSYNGRNGSGDNEKEHGVVRDIMDENAFLYAFQPIVSSRTGDIVAYEALMRSQQDPRLSPLTILKYASMDERLYDIELSTFTNVLKQVEQFKEELGDKKIFINSIPGHFLSDEDYKKLRQCYRELFPHLVVEITEETEFENNTAEVLRARSGADNFEVAVDDFGTGYSNMSNLLKFLPNYVKIDRTLIENVHEDPKKQHFVKTIIEFAHDNGFQALAEGVETNRELNAVVRMGVDMIQGYYTAKPSFTMEQTISAPIRDEIVRANFEGTHELRKKVYLVSREKELFLMHLAMEHYTSVVISQPELTLHGNPDFMAGLTLKIKEGCDCTLRISNVKLGDVDHVPCIDIGKGASLRLILEGSSEFEGNGIHVPEDSSLIVEGNGNLSICPILSEAYCIGAEPGAAFGRIELCPSGTMTLRAEGTHCVCIGGGRCQSGDGIRITAGRYEMGLAGTECVGIGCFTGEVPISITDAALFVEARIGAGTVVGALKGRQNIEIRDVAMEITGSGSCLTGIGSYEETGGSVRIDSASVHIRFNGRKLFMIGAKAGKLYISISTSDIEILGEGNMALGLGTVSDEAELRLINTRLGIVLRVGAPKALGVAEDAMLVVGGTHHMNINENESDF
ncbi:MAG: GGDEF domain-containing protein [Lachnospiraceae bacterium]|nr:GGDEF domain-containing protein [Lachnospiraceae bacterium]